MSRPKWDEPVAPALPVPAGVDAWPAGTIGPAMDPTTRVCPFCGELPGAGMFCEACGRNLAGVEQLPTRAEWEEGGQVASDPAEVAERCARATASFLAAMHAAGDPGLRDDVFPPTGALRRKRGPAAWVVRAVHREPDDDIQAYVPGLVLTAAGTFHRLESEVRGWGQRDFPRFVDTAAAEPIEPPAEPHIIGELDAVLREHGVVADPPLAAS